jgi:pyruvate/2-oxoglutarate dehydrogenase complex dihydrolipoamide acyltransferase (E2) component
VLERRLDKTILRAPADGTVSVIVAEVGENVRAGEPVLVIEETSKRWLSFNVREDHLHGLTVGTRLGAARAGAPGPVPALVTELVPLGPFATWQAERAIGDHDRNTVRLRLDPQGNATGFDPGVTVWIVRHARNAGALHSHDRIRATAGKTDLGSVRPSRHESNIAIHVVPGVHRAVDRPNERCLATVLYPPIERPPPPSGGYRWQTSAFFLTSQFGRSARYGCFTDMNMQYGRFRDAQTSG